MLEQLVSLKNNNKNLKSRNQISITHVNFTSQVDNNYTTFGNKIRFNKQWNLVTQVLRSINYQRTC